MKKLLIGLVAAGVLLVAAVLIAPSFIDWNAHKKQIAALVQDATGRALTIRGNIDVTILPSPALRVEDVRLASIPGAVSPEMIRLPEARISIAFGSLFEGRLAAVVTLIRPTVNLEKLQDGRVNWDFASADRAGAAGSPDGPAKAAAGMPLDVKLDSFRIVNGSVSYHDAASGTVERIGKLNSEVSFDSLNGPFRVDGTATVRGIPLALKVSTGKMKPGTPISTIIELSVPGSDSTVRLNGTVAGLEGEPTVQGEIELKSPSLARLMSSAFAVDAPAVLAQPLAAEGSLSASKQSVVLGAIDIELGSARATANVKADLADTPRVAVSVESGNLNLDTFLDGAKAVGAARPAAAEQGNGGAASSAASGSPQMKTVPDAGFVLPAMVVAFTASADIVQYNGALVRDLSAKGTLKDGRIVVEDVSAVMPGNTALGLKGTVGAVDRKPDMNLALSGRSDNLREMLEWVGVDTASIPADRLRRFSLSAAITGSPRNITAKDIGIQLDASKISGGLALVLRDRPAFGLRLVVDRVNIDGYMPGRDSPIGTPPAVSMPSGAADKPADARPAGIPGFADALAFLEKFDANIDATVKNFIVSRTPASDLHLDFTVLNGGLEVREAGIGDLAGLRGNLKGTLDRTKPQPVVTADYAVEIVDPARFARFIDRPGLLSHRSAGQLASSGRIDGNFEQLAVNARLKALGISVDVNGVLSSLLQEPAFKLATSVRAPELVQMVRLAAEEYSPAAGKLGPVNLTFQLEGSRDRLSAQSITGHAGPVTLHGAADIALGDPRPRLKVALTTSEISMDLFLPPEGRRASRAPVVYRIIPAAASPSGRSESRWSAEPIDLGMLEALDAEISLDMAALAKDPYRLKDTKLRIRLDEGSLSLDQMDGIFSTGTVTATGALMPDAGKLAGSLKFAANGVDVADLIEALRHYQARLGPIRFGAKMRGPVTLSGEFETRGASERELISALSGSARLTGQLRTEMSSETRQASAVAGLAGALLGKRVKEIRGVTDVVQGTDLLISAFEGPSTLNGDIAAGNGVFTTRNLVLVGRGGRALTSATASLPAWSLESVTDVTLGQDADPYLTVRAVGPLDDPYVRKISGTLLRGQPVSKTGQPAATQQESADQSGAKVVRPQEAEQPLQHGKVKPEDVLKGLLQGLSR